MKTCGETMEKKHVDGMGWDERMNAWGDVGSASVLWWYVNYRQGSCSGRDWRSDQHHGHTVTTCAHSSIAAAANHYHS